MLAFLPLSVFADVINVSPNTERGVSPGKAFQVGDLDNINLFNGNLNVRIPLGQAYPAGDSLSYGFALHYSGNAWETWSRTTMAEIPCPPGDYPPCTIERTYSWSFPSRRNNAGFGWLVSLGSLYKQDGATDWTYESPDGGLHNFYQTLHPNDAVTPNVYYTRDGTYLRLKTGLPNSELALEFPNGDIHTFSLVTPQSAHIVEIKDRFSNNVTVDYPDANTWHIQDSQGRSQYVKFKTGPVYEETGTSYSSPAVAVPHLVVDEVKLTAFDGKTLSYKFHYVGEGASWTLLTRPIVGFPEDPSVLSPRTTAAVLSSVEAFDGDASLLKYSMVHDDGNGEEYTGLSGTLKQLTLPTGGTILWNYMTYVLVPDDSEPGAHAVGVPGVAERLVTTGAAGTGQTISRTTYNSEWTGSYAPAHEKTETVTHYDSGNRPIVRSRTHFNLCPRVFFATSTDGAQTGFGGQYCNTGGQYGLPIGEETDSTGTRYLSEEIQAPDGNGWTTQRKTYRRYEGDVPLVSNVTSLDWNRRMSSERVVNLHSGGTSDIADVDSSSFDGLGHYRTTTTGGNFGRADVRSATTMFNQSAGTYAVQSDGSTPGFTMWPAASPWILNTYAYSTVSETLPNASTATTAMTQYCFDSQTGFLLRRRQLVNASTNATLPATGSHDLLVAFVRQSNGNIDEYYYGGDDVSLSDGTCSDSLSGEKYRIGHTFSYGTLDTSAYKDQNGTAMSFKIVDRTIDPNTGLPSTVRDRASAADTTGLKTNLLYDALSRLTHVNRASGSWTSYVYQMQPPEVDQYEYHNGQTASPMTHTWAKFDVLGRTVEQGRDMPPIVSGTTQVTGQQAKQILTYNGLGWKLAETEWAVSPLLSTTYQYDVFGRPTLVTAPDGTSVSLEYAGAKSTARTVSVATTLDPPLQPASTTETYDRQGRLWTVTDPLNTVTEYTYDLGGRLQQVCMNKSSSTCGQTRTFTYDNRGLLKSETHPEIGSNGNGSTTYDSYDARGHLLRRYEGGQFGDYDVSFEYDRAERLTKVAEKRQTNGIARTLKVFEYGIDNASGDYQNGQLIHATRYNWLDNFVTPSGVVTPSNIQMVQENVYRGIGGRISSRTTKEFDCVIGTGQTCNTTLSDSQVTRQFVTGFTYDDLGEPSGTTYPSCQTGDCSTTLPAPPAVTFSYDHGSLTSVVTSSAGTSNLAYAQDGQLGRVTHGNSVQDNIAPDRGMTRPLSISTANAVESSTCTPPLISVQPGGGTITAGQTFTLTATASGDTITATHPLTLEWYASSAPGTPLTPTSVTSSGNTKTATLAVAPSSTTGYWLKASNNCGSGGAAVSAVSDTATVSICDTPAITNQLTEPPTITRGMSSTLTVAASGSNLKYQWTAGGLLIPGATGNSITVSPQQTTDYIVYVSNNCSGLVHADFSLTVTTPPTAPAWLTASFIPNAGTGTGANVAGHNLVSWAASTAGAGIQFYALERHMAGVVNTGFAYVTSVAPTQTTFNDVSVSGGSAYVYRVRAVDNNGAVSGYSANDVATAFVFDDDPANPAGGPRTRVKGVHIGQLRQAVDAVRAAALLPAAFTNYSAVTGRVLAQNIVALRFALDEARLNLLPAILYSSPTPVHGTRIRATDIQDIRTGVK